MSSIPAFATYALHFSQYKYILIFLWTIVEWPILMIACGFLLKIGSLDFLPVFISVALWDLVGDVFWYSVWRYFLDWFSRKYGRFFWLTEELIWKIKLLFKKFDTSILFISKVTLWFGAALVTLMVAGASHIPFKKYMLINFLGETILVLILFFLGYFLGNTYTLIADNLKYYFLGGVVIIIPTILYFFHKYFKTKILDSWSLL